MKQVLSSIAAIAFSTISFAFISSQSAEALEEGLYWGGGSRYIRIAKQEASSDRPERICYHGFSPNGSTIVSLKLAIPRYETGIDYEVYLLEAPKNSNFDNQAILQYAFSPEKITFGKLVKRFVRGGSVYVRDGVAATDTTPALQECLNSTQPYFKQITSGRDRR